MENQVEGVIENQIGFWRGKSTRDAIGLMGIISEKVLDVVQKCQMDHTAGNV